MNDFQKRILIVDDDDEIRELLEFDVAQSGYFVDVAKDGLEGLNKALNNTYDLILLDVMMPKMNGFDVCKTIRQAKLAIPILMLTAKGTIYDKTEGTNCSNNAVLSSDYCLRGAANSAVKYYKCAVPSVSIAKRSLAEKQILSSESTKTYTCSHAAAALSTRC